MREAAKIMIEQGHGGAILNFASSFAIVGSPGYFAYHASKGAIASMTRAAAIALLPYGIRSIPLLPARWILPDCMTARGIQVTKPLDCRASWPFSP